MGKKLVLIAVGTVAVVVLVGVGYLATVDFPPPKEPVEKVIPDDRFKR